MNDVIFDAQGHVEAAAAKDDGFDDAIFSGTAVALHRSLFIDLEELRPMMARLGPLTSRTP